MKRSDPTATPSRSFVISLDNRKARGAGHERRREILTAARELFLEHGIENATTRQIASQVGFRRPHSMRTSKRRTRCRRACRRSVRQTRRIACGAGGRSRQPGGVSACRSPSLYPLRHRESRRVSPCLSTKDGRQRSAEALEARRQAPGFAVFATLEIHVAAGLAAGLLRSPGASSRAVAQAIWAAIHGLVALLLAYRDFDWVPLDELIEVHSNMLMHGLFLKSPPDAA